VWSGSRHSWAEDIPDRLDTKFVPRSRGSLSVNKGRNTNGGKQIFPTMGNLCRVADKKSVQTKFIRKCKGVLKGGDAAKSKKDGAG
jgi:hypothetical protein